jgi:hypothetical protein
MVEKRGIRNAILWSDTPYRGKPSAKRYRYTSAYIHDKSNNTLGKYISQSFNLSVINIATMSSKHIPTRHKQQYPNDEHPKFRCLQLGTSGPQDCALTGSALLNTPYFNKGSAFPPNERREFSLTGLLPQHVATLDEQVERAYRQYSTRQDDLAKNTFMTSMKEQNEVLYYRVR